MNGQNKKKTTTTTTTTTADLGTRKNCPAPGPPMATQTLPTGNATARH